ncbi:MAG: ankyrin repeat domain-containing protein [Candidatus Delongbacteria bacterium]|nr:ankyrin repeat domain-containing protein [Candidatus Delongbacteria bacterium]
MRTLKLLSIVLWAELIIVHSVMAQSLFDMIENRKTDEIKTMIQQHPDLMKQPDRYGRYPIHLAASKGNQELVEFMISQGADPNSVTPHQTSLMHFAAFGGNARIVAALIHQGIAVDPVNRQGVTPLIYAAQIGNLEIVHLLIEHGADYHYQDPTGRTALFHTLENGKQEVGDYLISLGINRLDIRSLSGNTLLHAAVKSGLHSSARSLLKLGIDHGISNRYGDTPIMIALYRHDSLMTDLIVKHGAQRPHGDQTDSAGFGLIGQYPMDSMPHLHHAALFAPGFISTEDSPERDICISPDYRELFFSRHTKIHQTIRTEQGWLKPEPVAFIHHPRSLEAMLTPDGERLYFVSQTSLPGQSSLTPFHIRFSDRGSQGWNPPQSLDSSFENCFYPSLTHQGIMYYTGPDNQIYRTRYHNGTFMPPEKLDSLINASTDQYNALIAPDESFLIYTSWRNHPSDFGGGDLYINFRSSDGQWSRAFNLGPEVNTSFHEYCPSLSPDGRYLFFTSDRFGNEDIFVIPADIIDGLKMQNKKTEIMEKK